MCFNSLYNTKQILCLCIYTMYFRFNATTLRNFPVVYVLCFFKADLIFFHIILQLHHRVFTETMKLHDFFFGIV